MQFIDDAEFQVAIDLVSCESAEIHSPRRRRYSIVPEQC
jgi:hypothetical protein